MTHHFVLKGDQQTIEVTEGGKYSWCRCYYWDERIGIFLGANGIKPIVTGLLDAVAEEVGFVEYMRVPDAVFKGHSVRQVMMTSETHYLLLVSGAGSTRLLFWLDKNCNLLVTIELSSIKREQWREQLEAIRNQLQGTAFWQ